MVSRVSGGEPGPVLPAGGGGICRNSGADRLRLTRWSPGGPERNRGRSGARRLLARQSCRRPVSGSIPSTTSPAGHQRQPESGQHPPYCVSRQDLGPKWAAELCSRRTAWRAGSRHGTSIRDIFRHQPLYGRAEAGWLVGAVPGELGSWSGSGDAGRMLGRFDLRPTIARLVAEYVKNASPGHGLTGLMATIRRFARWIGHHRQATTHQIGPPRWPPGLGAVRTGHKGKISTGNICHNRAPAAPARSLRAPARHLPGRLAPQVAPLARRADNVHRHAQRVGLRPRTTRTLTVTG